MGVTMVDIVLDVVYYDTVTQWHSDAMVDIVLDVVYHGTLTQ